MQIRDSEIFDDAFDDGLPSVDEATPVSKAPAKALKVHSDAPWCWSCVGSGVVEACADEGCVVRCGARCLRIRVLVRERASKRGDRREGEKERERERERG